MGPSIPRPETSSSSSCVVLAVNGVVGEALEPACVATWSTRFVAAIPLKSTALIVRALKSEAENVAVILSPAWRALLT